MPTQLECELLRVPRSKAPTYHMPSGHPWQKLQITILRSNAQNTPFHQQYWPNRVHEKKWRTISAQWRNETDTAVIIPKLHSAQTRSFAYAIYQYSTDPNSHADEACNMTNQKHSGVTDMQEKAACTRLGRGNTTDEHLRTSCTVRQIHTWQYASTECNTKQERKQRHNSS